MEIALGLGSNLGDRQHLLMLAIHSLIQHKCISNVTCSTFLTNKALLPADAPQDWDLEYINCVLIGQTEQSADTLLDTISEIEKQLGRDRCKKWQPRTIDIDILLYGTAIINSSTIVIPHYDLLARDFFLKPLRDIAPHWLFPEQGAYHNMTIDQIARSIYGK